MTGSAPSVKTTTEPTISGPQQALLAALSGSFGGVGPGNLGAVPSFGSVQGSDTGQYAAPLSNLQQLSLAGMEQLAAPLAGGPIGSGTAPGSSNANVFNRAIATQYGNTTANPVSMIDATNAFKTGVVEPLTEDFTNYTIPAISDRYGASAGGAYSSDALGAREQAGQNLARTLAQQGSQFALGAAQANQSAQATNAQLQQSAATSLPALLNEPLTLDLMQQQLLGSTLGAGAVPQATEQTQLSGEYGQYQASLQALQQYIADALGLSTAPTQQTQSVVNPGSTGFLAPLITALAGGAARGLTAGGGYLAPGGFFGSG